MAGFLVILTAGFAGSFHCVGMCGGFACGLGADPGGSRFSTAIRHVLYNTGRLVTYMFIGALAGALGTALLGNGTDSVTAHGSHMNNGASPFWFTGELGLSQRLLSVVAGGFMLLMALQLLGVLQHSRKSWRGVGNAYFASALGNLLTCRRRSVPVALGVINGFLPCPLVYAFAALAASTQSVTAGIATMAALGLGTFPAMLFMGSVGRMMSAVVRQRGVRLAGCFVLLVGAFTVMRGAAPSLLHLGHSM